MSEGQIAVPVDFFDWPQVKKLERRLGVGAVLSYLRLVAFSAREGLNGRLDDFTFEEIDAAAGWGDDSGDFLCALVSLHLVLYDGHRLRLVDTMLPEPMPVRREFSSETERERAVWNAMRKQVAPAIFKRDGYSCRYCGSKKRLTVDHIMPISRGGSHDEDNLMTACRSCNCRKHAKTPQEWQR